MTPTQLWFKAMSNVKQEMWKKCEAYPEIKTVLQHAASLSYSCSGRVLFQHCDIWPLRLSVVHSTLLVAAMADVSERTLQVSVLVAFASGVVLGWQANRLRRRYLDWRKRRLQDKLATTQKKLDLAWAPAAAQALPGPHSPSPTRPGSGEPRDHTPGEVAFARLAVTWFVPRPQRK